MKAAGKLSGALATCWLILAASHVAAENHHLKASCTLERHFSGLVRGEVDLGAFRPGDALEVSLQVSNLSQKPLDFTRVSTGCGCMTALPSQGEVSKGNPLTFDLRIEVSGHPRVVNYTRGLTAFDGESRAFVVRLNYTLDSVVTFRERHMLIEARHGAQSHSTTIPLIIGKGVKKQDVALDVGTGLEDHEANLDWDRKCLTLVFKGKKDPVNTASGTINVTNTATGFTSSLPVTIVRKNPVKVFPSILRFKSVEEDGAQRFVAKAAISVDPQTLKQEKTTSTRSVLEFSYQGQPLIHEVLRSKRNMTWVSVSMQDRPELSTDGTNRIRCRVMSGKHKHALTIPFHVSSEVAKETNDEDRP